MIYKRETSRKLTLSTNIKFGKYKGKSVFDIIKADKQYVKWLCSKWEGEICWKLKDIINED